MFSSIIHFIQLRNYDYVTERLGYCMLTIAEFMKLDMERRSMSLREYAHFIGSTHPTVSKYLNEPDKHVQWDFLLQLSRATHTDIGTLARMAAPEVAFEDVPDTRIIAERINQLPPDFRKTILDMVEAYLAQQKSAKNRH